MSTKMTAGLLSVICVCTIGTGLVAGHVAEKHERAESTTTTTATGAGVLPGDESVGTGLTNAHQSPSSIGISPEPPPIPVPIPGPASAPAGPGETSGATVVETTLAETVTSTEPSPIVTLPTVTLPTVTLPTITLPPVTIPTVRLGAAAGCAVLGASTVTNTGLTVVTGDLCLFPGTSVTGFLPGVVIGLIDAANDAAAQAQADLTSAYLDAGGRASGTVPAELGGLTLGAGVYSGAGQSPLHLTGTLTLDGEGDPGAVFIFQTDSTLVTASGSSVRLINGARACNVFWQVGSSATLGTFSAFAGTIMAQASITVTTGVTVQGRVLARNAAVTLDSDVITAPC